jgi:hypothetical protein
MIALFLCPVFLQVLTIRCLLSIITENGASLTFPLKVRVTPQDFDCNAHLDKALSFASQKGAVSSVVLEEHDLDVEDRFRLFSWDHAITL